MLQNLLRYTSNGPYISSDGWRPRKFKALCLLNRCYINVFFYSKAGILMLDNILLGNSTKY